MIFWISQLFLCGKHKKYLTIENKRLKSVSNMRDDEHKKA